MFLKILAGMVFIVIAIFGGYIVGYGDGQEYATANCPDIKTEIEWRTLNVPIPCDPTNITCDCKNQTVTKTQEKVVYRDVAGEKYQADCYYQVAIKEQDDYYDDIQHNRFDECEAKLEKSQDYLLTAIGFYQSSDQDLTVRIKALENYRLVLLTILDYCKKPEGRTFPEVEDEYEKYYDKYSRYINLTGEKELPIKT